MSAEANKVSVNKYRWSDSPTRKVYGRIEREERCLQGAKCRRRNERE